MLVRQPLSSDDVAWEQSVFLNLHEDIPGRPLEPLFPGGPIGPGMPGGPGGPTTN